MSNKTRVLHVRVVGFSAPERQMLNSIFLLSVAPARQIGYKLWNPETGVAPDMYLLDGDSESAVASWQATFASTADRTLVVGGKNTDLGVAAASRPLGLKVVGAMDRLAIALSNASRELVGHEVSVPSAAASLPSVKVDDTGPTSPPKHNLTIPRPAPSPATTPSMSASMSSMAPLTAAANTMSTSSHAMTATAAAPMTHTGTLPTSMTSTAPVATVLPHMTLQPNVSAAFDRSINEKAVDKILSDKSAAEKAAVEKPVAEKASAEKPPLEKTAEKAVLERTPADKINAAAALIASGVTPLSPSALSAAVAPSPQRANLRVVSNTSPLAASLPSAARIADAPMAQPAAVAPAVAPAPVAALPPPVPVAPVAVPTPRHEEHNFRVLAVDDSPLMRTFLQNKLQPYGISPEFASSGEEALFKISKQHFDMIFLDVMLPGMDGYDVCKMIKKNKDNSLMKVVMLTSKDKTFDKIRGTMAGCDGYLTKPVDELKLRAIIERHTVTKK